MGWAVGYDTNWKRDIGYGVPAYCDYPDCNNEIHRGLSYVCGGEPYGGDRGCGLYFCAEHLVLHPRLPQLCERCSPKVQKPFTPKPDHPSWLLHKLTDESWARWRAETPLEVIRLSVEAHVRNIPKADHNLNIIEVKDFPRDIILMLSEPQNFVYHNMSTGKTCCGKFRYVDGRLAVDLNTECIDPSGRSNG